MAITITVSFGEGVEETLNVELDLHANEGQEDDSVEALDEEQEHLNPFKISHFIHELAREKRLRNLSGPAKRYYRRSWKRSQKLHLRSQLQFLDIETELYYEKQFSSRP